MPSAKALAMQDGQMVGRTARQMDGQTWLIKYTNLDPTHIDLKKQVSSWVVIAPYSVKWFLDKF